MPEISSPGQTVDVVEVDPTLGRLLSVAQLQQGLRFAVTMPTAEFLPQPTLDQAPARGIDRCGSLAAGPAICGDSPAPEISPAALGVDGASGGCGETVLAQLMAGGQPEQRLQVVATDHRWPTGDNDSWPVVRCARTTIASPEAAQRAAAEREPRAIPDFARLWAAGGEQ